MLEADKSLASEMVGLATNNPECGGDRTGGVKELDQVFAHSLIG